MDKRNAGTNEEADPTALKGLLKKTGRHSDGQGLYFRAPLATPSAYWVYRFRINGREREMSLGPYPEMTLAEARAKHAALRKTVIADGVDPLAPEEQARPQDQYRGADLRRDG